MKEQAKLAMFEGKKIRRIWDEKREKWYFSVIDIVSILTQQDNFKKAQSYWTTLKSRLKQEGSESVTKCDKLKLQSADGKFYKTDVADVETLLRLIQSVPSPKAEPIKLWLARQIAETMRSEGLEENKLPARKGGNIAKNARMELEQKTGKKVISGSNYLPQKKKGLKSKKYDKHTRKTI